MLTDTHCHIDFDIFNKDRNNILRNCLSANIHRLIVPSVKSNSWANTLKICDESSMLTPALGLHPFFLSEHKKTDLVLLEDYCKKDKLSAIGEIGLDYLIIKKESIEYKDRDSKKSLQLFFFEEQLLLAKRYNLPVLIHARKSHQDIIQLLKKHKPLKGIIHAFNGSEEQAKQYIELGFLLGFGGAFTNNNAKHLQQLVRVLPLNSMVLETDAPDMMPYFALNNRLDKRNSPENIIGIYEHFVLLRNENSSVIELQLENNIQKLFNFPE